MRLKTLGHLIGATVLLLIGWLGSVTCAALYVANPPAAILAAALFLTWATLGLNRYRRGGGHTKPAQLVELEARHGVDRAEVAAAQTTERAAVDGIDLLLCVMSGTTEATTAADYLADMAARPGAAIVWQRAAAMTRTGAGMADPGELGPRMWTAELVELGKRYADASIMRRMLDRSHHGARP